MIPVYYLLGSAASLLAVLRFGVVPVVTAIRRANTGRRELINSVQQLVTSVNKLTGRVEHLEKAPSA